MTTRLQAEIKQRKPFTSLEEEAYVNLLRTADVLLAAFEKEIKPAGLTPTQYNALRIVRGAGPGGRTCQEVARRMLTRDPDVTRLLDRLEKRGLVARARDRKDRRVITVRITQTGLETLKALDKRVTEFHTRLLGHLDRRGLQLLVTLLEQARESQA